MGWPATQNANLFIYKSELSVNVRPKIKLKINVSRNRKSLNIFLCFATTLKVFIN